VTRWCTHEYKPALGFEKVIFVFCVGQIALVIFAIPTVSLALVAEPLLHLHWCER
jgi:hypothetical protein